MKKNSTPEYKGYHAIIEYDPISMVIHGRIDGINDLVTFESDNAREIINEFHSAVDDYLAFCKDVGKEPCKEYKGTFNVRIAPELHKELADLAILHEKSLNSCIEDAVRFYLYKEFLSGYTSGGKIKSENTYSSSEPSSCEYSNVTPISSEVC